MNDTIMHYIMYLATFLYLFYVTIYMIKNIPKQQNPLLGLIFSLDIFRYTSMFLSFMLTMYFGTKWGNGLIGSYPLDPLETIFAYALTITISASASALISSLLLYAERAVTSGILSQKQLIAVASIYIVAAGLDFLTLSMGGGSIAQSFADEKIAKIEMKQDTSSLLVIDFKKDIALDLKEQLNTIKRDINNISSTQPKLTKRVRTLNATLVRCAKKNKPCPDTNAELARITRSQYDKRLELLNKKRTSIVSKLFEITNSYENTSTRLKTEKNKEIEEINKNLKSLLWWITFTAIIFVAVNLFTAFVRGILADSIEVKEVGETGEVAGLAMEEKRHYIFEAMKQRARDLEYKIREDNPQGTETMVFPRDKMREKAIYLAGKDKKIMTIGKDSVIPIITDMKKRGGVLERWLVTQSWNMFDPSDESYKDDLEAY